MKRFINLITTFLSVAGIAISACSKNELEPRPHGTAIVLGADVKSNMVLNTNTFFAANVAGWEGISEPDYGLASTWISHFSALVTETPQAVQLTKEVFYNSNPQISTWMKAWHPQGSLSTNGQVDFVNTPDGTVDVMLTHTVCGNSNDVPNKNLSFEHLLSQVRFQIKLAVPLNNPPTLTSITVHGVKLPIGIDLKRDTVINGNQASYTIKDITAGLVTFTTTEQTVGSPLLLCPFNGNTIKVDIATSKGSYSNVTATIANDNNFTPGKVYTITLTYTGQDSTPLGATIRVSDWANVSGGESDLPM